jgi:hypothetical protein
MTLESQDVKLARMEGKLDLIVMRLDRADMQSDKDDLVNRVATLERSRSYLLGAGVAGGAFVSWIIGLISHALTK